VTAAATAHEAAEHVSRLPTAAAAAGAAATAAAFAAAVAVGDDGSYAHVTTVQAAAGY